VSVVAIILLAIAVVLVFLFFIGAFANSRHRARTASTVRERAQAADRDLAAAEAKDRGWNRDVLEAAVRDAWSRREGAPPIDEIALLAVIDPPGTDSDRAEFLVTAGETAAEIRLARTGDAWAEEPTGGAQPSGSSPSDA
jgi:hypothetical protein